MNCQSTQSHPRWKALGPGREAFLEQDAVWAAFTRAAWRHGVESVEATTAWEHWRRLRAISGDSPGKTGTGCQTITQVTP